MFSLLLKDLISDFNNLKKKLINLIMLKILWQTIFIQIDHKVPLLEIMFDQLAVCSN